jgi:flagellar protein FlaG
MANDIMSASLSTTNRTREPMRSVGTSPTEKVIDTKPLLPVSGEKLPPATSQRPTPSENLDNAVKQLNDYIQSVRRDLQFSIDKDSGRTVIKVVDSQTKEVIRQYPAEEVLKAAKELSTGNGLLIRVKA